MLVFSARAGDVIEIDDETAVTVIATESGRVRLGVAAPRDVAERVAHRPAERQPAAATSLPDRDEPVSSASADGDRRRADRERWPSG